MIFKDKILSFYYLNQKIKMVKCSICGSPNTNKTSCPLFLKFPKKENWEKHFLAKSKTKSKTDEKTKTKSKLNEKLPNPKVKQMKYNESVKVKSINPYYKFYLTIKEISVFLNNKISQAFCSNAYKIILFGVELKKLRINISDPKSLKIEIKLTKKFQTEFNNYVDLLKDAYKTIGSLKCNRKDYFTNPDPRTMNLLDIIGEITNQIVKIIVNNRYYGGGNCNDILPNGTLENILDKLEGEYIEQRFSELKPTPTIIPKISVKKRVGVSCN